MPPSATGTIIEDPEILPDKVTTPEGEVTDLSQDFTLSDEEEGDNISGNKELRDDKDTEEETNSKRVKVPLKPPKQNERTPCTPTTKSNIRTRTKGRNRAP